MYDGTINQLVAIAVLKMLQKDTWIFGTFVMVAE
jgi:hypothetical protein